MSAARRAERRSWPAAIADLRLVARQTRYEQLAFWRNPVGAGLTVGFSTIFLVLLAATGGTARVAFLGNIRTVQYYVAGFLAYGVMSSCFNTLALSLVVRREEGLLKRLRLTPLPPWAALGAVLANAVIVSAVQVVVLLLIGRLGYGLELPHDDLALVVALAVGVLCFSALGMAATSLIPNQEAGGPVLGILFFVLLWLSGLWYPITSTSVLAHISSVFPIRHFIVATFAPFDLRPGISAWSWHALGVMALWGVAGMLVAIRRFRWEPRQR